MKSLLEVINEASSLRYNYNNMSCKELLVAYWKEWSGMYDGRGGQTSKTIKIGDTIRSKWPSVYNDLLRLDPNGDNFVNWSKEAEAMHPNYGMSNFGIMKAAKEEDAFMMGKIEEYCKKNNIK